MRIPPYQVRQCRAADCRFRFPVTEARERGEVCPLCGAVTALTAVYPTYPRQPTTAVRPAAPPLAALLDNIRSIYNVGSMLRTADGAGLSHLYCAGITPPPDHPKIAKTALGAETAVSWSHHNNGLETAVALKGAGHQLWALESAPDAENLLATAVPAASPILLIVGHEIAGVDPAILDICHKILTIPMRGVKNSLNVASAFAVAAYALTGRRG